MTRHRRRTSLRSQPRVGPCPGCGGAIFWALYVPEPPRLDPSRPRRRLPLDAAAGHVGNPLVSHAAPTSKATCRLISLEHPLEPHETAHSLHYATNPACRDVLLTTGRNA